MENAAHFARISRLLSYGAKRKVLQAVPLFLGRVRALRNHPDALWHAAVDALRPAFRSASAGELNVLAFYLVAKVVVAHSGVVRPAHSYRPDIPDLAEPLRLKLDLPVSISSMNEMSEMTSLRLQMMMDRRSKFMSTLSNIMNKISTTQDTLVKNLK